MVSSYIYNNTLSLIWAVTLWETSLISDLSISSSFNLHWLSNRLKFYSRSNYFCWVVLSLAENMVLRRLVYSLVNWVRLAFAWTIKTSISSYIMVHSGNCSTGSYSSSGSDYLGVVCSLTSTFADWSPIFVTVALTALFPAVVHFFHRSYCACYCYCCFRSFF